MKHYYKLKASLILSSFLLVICCQSIGYSQISLTASGGTPSGSYVNVNDAFVAINAGTHTGTITLAVTGNTTEPATPVALAASGQGAASYTNILIKPTVVATIAGATTAGSAVINLDGADFVTIDGSTTLGGTTRDLTIQNTALNTVGNVAAIRLIGRTTLGLGATNNTISNCNIIGSTPGNNGLSGSTITTTYGIYAGSTVATTMSSATGGADYDNLTVSNNAFSSAYIGMFVMGLVSPNQVDNLIVNGNTFGTATTGTRIGFKGFLGNHLVGGNFTNNTVLGILSTASVNIAGVEVGGSATSGFQIRRNTIYDIQQNSTAQYGAYGVNVVAGTAVVVSNNAIHGVTSVNYNSTSTTWQAYGIRLAGGTGHQIYYNSVNMYGNYTIATGGAFSAAFVVTGTGITGLDIRNNIFANSMTTTETANVEFHAVYFPASYNFTTTNLERNAYMVSPDAQHFVGKIGATMGTNNFSSLNAWRTISQVSNPTNDVNSQPGSGNANAPFTSNTDLTIPAATVTVLESTGLPVASLGLPNVDRNNVNRPAGTGTNPDLGAYEFEGSQPADLAPPAISGVAVTPGASCTTVPHTVTATVTDNVGVASVTLNYTFGGVAQTPITMTLTSGNATNGTYSGTIPAAPGANIAVTFSVTAQDATPNIAAAVPGTPYTDQYLVLTASPDVTINTGANTTINATGNTAAFSTALISEVIQFRTGTGDGTYPAYVPAGDNDFIEISNVSASPLDLSGYTMTVYGGVSGSYTIPAGTTVASGGVMVLAFAATTNSPVDNYYGMGILSTSSGVANGYVLRNSTGDILDAVATNGYTFLAASGVTAAQWSGNLPSSSGLAGVRRTAAVDNNTASNWTLSSAVNVTNVGVFNSQISVSTGAPVVTWTNNFNAVVTTVNPLTVSFPTAGVYTYTASYTDGTCTATDNVVITVLDPVAPVANFMATPVSGSAPLTVNFTDQSTNIPTSWSWSVSPSLGVTYIAATSNTSQNPVMSFANAGLYTITLTAANSAGSDDTTRIQYIDVSFCNSAATNTADTDIGNVTFGGLNNGAGTPTFSNPAATGLYTNYMALTPATFGVGTTYPISVTQITSGATFYNAHVNVFIDYNNDGAFDPVTERAFQGPTSNVGPIATVSGTVTIPMTATLATVRMRVILQEGGTATSAPCGTYSYGETEDYLINLICGSTSPATSPVVICSGDDAIFNAAGNGVQWYVDNVTTTAVASGNTYNAGALTSGTSYYASTTDPGCAESGRTEFVLTVNQPTTSTEVQSACGSYTWMQNGATYSVSGMYNDTILNAAGCDSIITLDLTILTAVGSTETVSQCVSYTWPSNGTTYSTSGMYTDTLVSASGCDSILTLDLTILAPTSSTTTLSECGSYTWSANGTTYTTTGIYTATLVNAAGCDSIATLNLTVVNPNLGVTVSGTTLTATQGSATYQWINCAGNTPIAGQTSQSFTPTANGSYAVIVTVSGCSDTSACTVINNIGLGENELSEVMIAPNPTQSFVTITFEVPSAQLTVMDMNGRMVMSKEIVSGDQIDLTNYDYGVYFFTISSGELTTVKRVVKQ